MTLNHPNIVKCIEYRSNGKVVQSDGKEKDAQYLVLEYADLEHLKNIIREYDSMNEDIARFLFSQLVDAVAYLHKNNYAHRDIKEFNILLNSGPDMIKLADLGSSVLLKKKGEKVLDFKGHRSYRPPETSDPKNHNKPIPHCPFAHDVFSCGSVLFGMLTRIMHPFFLDGKQPLNECPNYCFILNGDYQGFWEHMR
jgi:serine/threonine protein kinase